VDSPYVNPHLTSIFLKEGVLPIKWESSWDGIGQISNMSLNAKITPTYSKRSNGWAHRLKSNSQFNAHFRT